MTAQPAELPSNAPNPTPTNIPTGDKLLKDFKTTLEVRWSEFDKATLEEAMGSSYFRNKDSDFIKAKATFDTAKAMLEPIQNDAQLKSDTKVLPTVEAALKSITDYLKEVKPEEKGKKINIILANTTADLTKFKADITGKLEDQKSAEDAKVSVATAIAAGGGVLATEAAEGLSKAVGEGAKDLGKEAAAIKKNPIKKIAEFFGFSETSIVGDFKSALAEKKEGGFGGFFGGIKVWFYGFLAKMFGTDLTKHLSPEELKLAGIVPPIAKPEDPKPAVETQRLKDKYTGSRFIFEGLFLPNSKPPITDILDNIEMKGSKIGELKKISETKDYGTFLKKIGRPQDDSNKKGLEDILGVLFSPKKGKYILESYNSSVGVKRESPFPGDVTFGDYIIGASKLLKRMRGVAKAAMTQEMPQSSIRFDTSGNVTFDHSEDEEGVSESLFDGNKKLLAFMLTTNAKSGYKIGKSAEFFAGLENNHTMQSLFSTSAEKEKTLATLKKITDFGDTFMKALSTNPDINLGMSQEITDIMNNKTFTLRGLALIYISMEGKDITKFSELSTVEHAQVYGIVTTIFQTVDKSFDKAALVSRYMSNLTSSTADIPKGVKEFLGEATQYAIEKGERGIVESIKYFFGLASENPRLAIAFAAMNLPIIPARDSAVSYIFQ